MKQAQVLTATGLGTAPVLPATTDGHRWFGKGPERHVHTPIDGARLAGVRDTTAGEYEKVAANLHHAFAAWRLVPAPVRGQLVRAWGEALRKDKEALGRLVSLEMGKSLQEGFGEVQEMIDICDFAVGLSRTVGGRTLPSERVDHRMMEQWHPLGVVGVISAFNFPVAVYAWNAAIALVCGNTVLWKASEKTPLTAIAVQKRLMEVCKAAGHPGIVGLVTGGADVGERMIHDGRVALVSATGSCRMGARVGPVVAARMGRTILELGGNNAIIVGKSADLDLAMRAVVFGAVGTAGQRCTSTRRLYLHRDIATAFTKKLVAAYKQVKVGNPLASANHMGPLIDAQAVSHYQAAVAEAKKQGGKILFGGKALAKRGPTYVEPCIIQVESAATFTLSQEETFAPILYVFTVDSFEEAVQYQNGVRQGLSSAIFTRDLLEAERFLSAAGSDCGIANVNLGTSGAEIGGAFGGEKETGGGRESGSDAWKQYMRRQTNTINYGTALPLAQGIKFDF